MDKAEAIQIADNDLEFYRVLPYKSILERIGSAESYERVAANGEPYQIEFDFFLDDAETRNIRVVGMVSYSGWTDFLPVSSDFIIAPNGEFIGE